MALHGHPGKFTYCFAEAPDSPFPPLHCAFGLAADDTAVTVIGAEAPHSVIFSGSGDPETDEDALLTALAAGLAGIASNNATLTGGQAVVVLNPDHAQVFAALGRGREDVQAALHARCVHPLSAVRRVAPGLLPAGDEERAHKAFAEPADILVTVAGGSGLYSMVMPTWCAGPHRNRAVCEAIELDVFCEIPGLAG